MATPLLDCPNEVMVLIFRGPASNDHASSPSPALCQPPNLSLQDLRSLTLVSRRISDIANPILYQQSRDHHESSAVAWAASTGAIPTLNKALSFGLNIHDAATQALLHIAAQHGQDEVIHWLLDNGVNVDHHETHYCQPHPLGRHHSCPEGFGRYQLPLSHHIPALHVAICMGHISSTIALISRGASLRYRPCRCCLMGEGETRTHALIDAVYLGQHEIVEYLVNNTEANLNEADVAGAGIYVLATFEQPSMFTRLLDLGLDVNRTGSIYADSPLGQAFFFGSLILVETLLDRGARVDNAYIPENATTSWDPAPIHDLIMYSSTDEPQRDKVLRKLVDLGADVNKILAAGYGSNNETPLRCALFYGSSMDVKTIISAGAEVRLEDLRYFQQDLDPDDDWFEAMNGELFKKAEILMTHLTVSDKTVVSSTGKCLDWALNYLIHKGVFGRHLEKKPKKIAFKSVQKLSKAERAFLQRRVALLKVVIGCALDDDISDQHLDDVCTLDACDQNHGPCQALIKCVAAWDSIDARFQVSKSSFEAILQLSKNENQEALTDGDREEII